MAIVVFVLLACLVLGAVYAGHLASEQKAGEDRKRFHVLLNALEQSPADPQVHASFLRVIVTLTTLTQEQGEHAYQTSLRNLEVYPSSTAARIFALNVGRWHCGRSRSNKHPTIYDEQAMLNDIVVRTQYAGSSNEPANHFANAC